MRVLIVGGSRFVGWHIVAACLERGQRVTLLNRGIAAPDQWTGLPRISGDRQTVETEMRAALREDWDLIIDCCAHTPEDLAVTRLLRGHAGHYTLISSCAVHARRPTPSAAAKLACEQAAADLLGGTPLMLSRLGLTVGPRDPTDRLAYWLGRAITGGEALVPMQPTQPVSLIDARDVAAFIIDAAAAGLAGTYDVVGPVTTADQLLTSINQVAGRRVRWRWVPEAIALAAGLRPWNQVPLWIPGADTDARALMRRSPGPAVQAGLRHRPLTETLGDCLSWYTAHPRTNPGWLDRDAEAQLLDHLRTRRPA